MNSAFEPLLPEAPATYFAREIAGLKTEMRRSARRQRVLTALLAISSLLAGFQIAHGDSAGTFTAPFVVVDASGQKMFEVAKQSNQHNAMRLYNREGRIVVVGEADVGDDLHGRVGVSDPTSQTYVALFGEHAQSGSFGLFDNEGRNIVDAFRGERGGQGFGVYDQRGGLRIQAIVTGGEGVQISALVPGSSSAGAEVQVGLVADDEASQLVVNDSTGGPIATIGDERGPANSSDPAAKKDYSSRGLWLSQENGKSAITLQLTEDGAGKIRAYDSAGTPAAGLLVDDRDGGKVILRDPAGPGVQAELNGREGLKLYGADGSPMAGVYRTAQGGEIDLSNNAGGTIMRAKAEADGRGILAIGPAAGVNSLLVGRLQGQ